MKSVRKRWVDYLWPRMGWRRYLSYLRHRLGRMPGTSHSIAAGFASGAAMSMTPLMGVHFVLSALLAWALRGNIIASAIGTMVGNPWTFPIIWLLTYRLGCWMIGFEPVATPFHGFSFGDAIEAPWDMLKPIWIPMLIGSIPTAIVVWWVLYWPLVKVFDKYKRQRIERRHRRALAQIEQRHTVSSTEQAAPDR